MTPKSSDWWRAYLGIPVIWRGRDLQAGVDCFSLVEHVLPAEFGCPVELAPDDLPKDEKRGLVEAVKVVNARLPSWRPVQNEPGAVALFLQGGRPVHVGITINDAFFLHADWDARVVQAARFDDFRFERRLIGTFLPLA